MKSVLHCILLLALIPCSRSFSDNLDISNGYVIENVQFIDSLNGVMRFAGRDILISVLKSKIKSREFLDINGAQPTKIYVYYKEEYKSFLAQNPSAPDPATFQTIVTLHGETIKGAVYDEEADVVVFLTEYGEVSLSKDLIVQPKFQNGYTPSKYPLTVTMVNGESFKGALASSTDTTVTYKTSVGTVTVEKKNILSVSSSENEPNRDMPVPNRANGQSQQPTVIEKDSAPAGLIVLASVGAVLLVLILIGVAAR